MTSLPPEKKPRKKSIFEYEDWFVSAGLVMVIYILIWLFLRLYLEEESIIKLLVHALPLIALLMIGLGLYERSSRDRDKRERRQKRRQIEHELKKMNQPARPEAPKEKPDAEK